MGGHLRILTANLWNGRTRPLAIAELLRTRAVDVAAFQELAPEQADAIADVLPHGTLEPARNYTGMGIALRRPAEVSHLPLVFRDARIVHLEPDHWPALERPLEFVNVHISAPTSFPTWLQPIRRHRQVSELTRHLDASPELPRVLVGDLNSTPAWPVYWKIAARLEDLALTHARSRNRRAQGTWPTWLGGLRPLRIDHCFGRGVTIEGFETVQIDGADHFALLADLSLD